MRHLYFLLITVLFVVSLHAQLFVPPVCYQARLVSSRTAMASGDTVQIKWEITSDTGSVSALNAIYTWGGEGFYRSGYLLQISEDKSSCIFTSDRVYNTIRIWCHISNSELGIDFNDTVTINLIPSMDFELYIEPNAEGQSLSPMRPQLFPESILVISAIEQFKCVYAIIRDQYGNYVHPSENVVWSSLDTSKIRVSTGERAGEGIISKVYEQGQLVNVIATDTVLNISDTLKVRGINIGVAAREQNMIKSQGNISVAGRFFTFPFSENTRVKLVDLRGRVKAVLYEGSLMADHLKLSLPPLGKATYLIQIESEKTVVQEKLILGN